MTDELRDIPGYPDYAVTRDGRVWSKPRKDSRGCPKGGYWLRPGVASHGYPTVCLQGKSICLHVLVLTSWIGPRPKGFVCRHLDGDKRNNRVENLVWGTEHENRLDSYRLGELPKGGDSHFAKLTEQQVKDILYAYFVKKQSAISLALQYGLNRRHVHDLIAGRKCWKCLGDFRNQLIERTTCERSSI